MRTKLATALITPVVVAALGAHLSAGETERTEYMPCGAEDARNCVWDAKHMGNGIGQSYFVGKTGKVTYLPHHIAHYLLNGG